MRVETRIEALLFATDQPLGAGRMAELLPEATRADVEAALQNLEAEYASPERAFRLLQVGGGWQLASKPDFADLIRRMYTGKRRVRLTKAALETLAIIAYKQPTTRPEVDAIRGVASGGVLETLLERNLVQINGRSDGVGRPLLYTTTPEFLQYLGLNRLSDLPSLEELESMLNEREAESRRAEEEELLAMAEAARAAAPVGEDAAESAIESATGDDEGASEAPARSPAARLDERLREQQLPSLDELDTELRQRSDRVSELSVRVAAERARHAAEVAPIVDDPEPETPPGLEPPESAPQGEVGPARRAAAETEERPGLEPPESAPRGEAERARRAAAETAKRRGLESPESASNGETEREST